MSFNNIKIIYLKELREVVRDRRTLFIMIVLPILLYPMLMVIAVQLTTVQMAKLETQTFKVAVEGRDYSRDLASRLEASKRLEITKLAPTRENIIAEKIHLALIVPEDFDEQMKAGGSSKLSIKYNEASEKSQAALGRINEIIRKYKDEIVDGRLKGSNLTHDFLDPINVEKKNVAPEKVGAFYFGRVLALVIVTMAMSGAFYPAIDILAGEKERGTIETLMVSPANRKEIIISKFLIVLTISVVSATLNLASMTLTFGHFSSIAKLGEVKSWDLKLNIQAIIAIMIVLTPTAALFSAVSLALSSFARSYKEGQYYLTPLFIVATPLAMTALIPNMELSMFYCLIPIANVVLLLKELMLENYNWGHIILVFAATAFYASTAIKWAAGLFEREEVMFREPGEMSWRFWQRGHPAMRRKLPSQGDAIFLYVIGLTLIWYVGTYVQTKEIVSGLIITLTCLVVAPTLLYSGILRFDFKKTFRIRPISFGAALLTLLVAGSAFVLVIQLAELQRYIFPDQEAFTQEFSESMKKLTELGFWKLVLLIAVLPGLCEEVMFRGFILSGLEKGMGRWRAVLISGALFGLFHLHPVRFLPTAVLGMLIAYIVLRTGSIFAGMLAHATNNFLALTAEYNKDLLDHQAWISDYRAPLLVVAGIILVVCIALLKRYDKGGDTQPA